MKIETGRSIMTEWIARVYQTVKKSGQQRELAIRNPFQYRRMLFRRIGYPRVDSSWNR